MPAGARLKGATLKLETYKQHTLMEKSSLLNEIWEHNRITLSQFQVEHIANKYIIFTESQKIILCVYFGLH